MWFILALGLALLQRVEAAHRRWMRWAWSNPRLLALELADRPRIQISGVVSSSLAGIALSLSAAGLLASSEETMLCWPMVFRGFMVWTSLQFLRWLTSLFWDLHCGDPHIGDVFFLNHRVHMESAAWLIAPIGFVASSLGPSASHAGIMVACCIWALGWLLRLSRGVSRNPRLVQQPVLGILYLCGLEILPVAVLFRIWQG